MVCAPHRRYALPNELSLNLPAVPDWGEVVEFLEREHDARTILRVHLYDHPRGRIFWTTRLDELPEDGQVGLIFSTAEGDDEQLAEEVRLYAIWARGETYALQILDELGVVVETIGGFYGKQHAMARADECLREFIKAQERRLQRARARANPGTHGLVAADCPASGRPRAVPTSRLRRRRRGGDCAAG